MKHKNLTNFRLPITDYRLLTSGLSLIEMLLSLTLSAFLAIIIVNSLTSLIRSQRLLLAFNRLEVNTTRILNQLQTDIRWADIITVPDPQTINIIIDETNHITYQWDSDQQQLTRTLNNQILTTHPETVLLTDFEATNLRANTPKTNLPLIQLLITATPTDHLSRNKLILEKNITYTTKKTDYDI